VIQVQHSERKWPKWWFKPNIVSGKVAFVTRHTPMVHVRQVAFLM